MKTLTVDERLAALERKTFRLRFICGIQLALLAIVWFSSSQIWQAEAKDSVSILRARGLIIEDSLGHPRILGSGASSHSKT
jgi:hypothetical protein